jgi:hypothetical protein
LIQTSVCGLILSRYKSKTSTNLKVKNKTNGKRIKIKFDSETTCPGMCYNTASKIPGDLCSNYTTNHRSRVYAYPDLNK